MPQYELSYVSSLTSLPLLLHIPFFYPSPVPSLLSFVPPAPLIFALSSITNPHLSSLPSPLPSLQDINDDVKIAEFHRINDAPPEEPPLTQAEIGLELAKVSATGRKYSELDCGGV